MSEPILEPELPICDSHHHLWDNSSSRYLLPDLLADIESGHNIVCTVFMECNAFYRRFGSEPMRFVGETEFANGVAAMASSGRYGPVLVCEAIVGRADLAQGASVEVILDAHIRAGNGRFRGIRHIAAWDADPRVRRSHVAAPPGLYALPSFREGFAKLAPLGLSFDAWQYHPQLPELIDLARAFPQTKIMLDHVGGPLGAGRYSGRRSEIFDHWKKSILELSKYPNLYVKLGGLGMTTCGFDVSYSRAVRPNSKELAEIWRPYIETCIESFGADRAMFESNFPVDKVACDYSVLWNAMKRIVAGASQDEKLKLFRDNARRFYRLEVREP